MEPNVRAFSKVVSLLFDIQIDALLSSGKSTMSFEKILLF